jgi:sarcosine oxidase subunit beta
MHAPATGLVIAEEVLDGSAQSFAIDPLRIERYRTGSIFERNII